jgi:hypothetical protein
MPTRSDFLRNLVTDAADDPAAGMPSRSRMEQMAALLREAEPIGEFREDKDAEPSPVQVTIMIGAPAALPTGSNAKAKALRAAKNEEVK